jgi:hypothetical protein
MNKRSNLRAGNGIELIRYRFSLQKKKIIINKDID